MKKLILVLLITGFLMPASLFAAPSDEEVYEAFGGIMGVFAMVFMSSMFGQPPENVTIDSDMETGAMTMVFENFEVKEFAEGMSQMSGEEDDFEIDFTEMSGTIDIDQEENLNIDMDLKGGNVKNFEMQSKGEDIVTIKANGRNYNHLREGIMAGMAEEE